MALPPWAPLAASWLLLAFGLWAAASVVNARHPRAARYAGYVPRFFWAWYILELPVHHLVGGLVAVGGLIALGALGHPAGWVGAGAAGVAFVGLGTVIATALRAGPTVRAALGELAGAEPGPRAPLWQVLFPFFMGRRGVRVQRDVTYARVGGQRLKLDVYRPAPDAPHANAQGRRPAVVQIHGGAWVIGSKREQGVPLLYHLAGAGFVGFNVNYRLSPIATFPDHLSDIKRAIAWVREHAEEYGVDPEFVAVTGGSAGGHLSALAGLTGNEREYQPGFERADTSVQAAVPFYGVYCFLDRLGLYHPRFHKALLEPVVMKAFLQEEPDRFRKASPLDQVHSGAPPFFILHGEQDTLAPVEYARAFAEALRERSHAPVAFAELPGAHHVFELFPSLRARPVFEGVERFLTEQVRRVRQAVRPPAGATAAGAPAARPRSAPAAGPSGSAPPLPLTEEGSPPETSAQPSPRVQATPALTSTP